MKATQNEKCTALKGAPVIFIDILNHPELSKYDLSSLEYILLGASTIPKDLIVKIKEKLKLKHMLNG
jgi:acyl-CoA synthetase (AMP-forming)/AMP-acid ligase II